MNEEWRGVKGFPDYQVSSMGRIKSVSRISRAGRRLKERIMKQRLDREHKLSCNLISEDGVSYRKYVHIEMAKAFLGEYKPDDDVSMKDGNPFNLVPENLFLENRIDRRNRILNSENTKSKNPVHLDKEKKERIRDYIKSGFSNARIAREENVKRQQVARIRKKLTKEMRKNERNDKGI